MRFLKSNFLKRIVVIIAIIMVVLSSIASPVHASKVKMGENDFYYAGTSKGQYKVSMSILAWLLEFIKQIAGFLFALITMIPRMAFVGWTAIFELLLTAGLNTFTGVPMENSNPNATNVDANGVADHVTVQAIVFNMVPVLNCNLFDFEDKSKMNTCVDGTGHFWIKCETCAAKDPLIATNPSRPHLCRMKGQCTCTECAAYREAFDVKENDENPYLIIKKNIAMWYYIMRLMAAAAMLAVLIYVGIKIAITTVASEKAVFKRMLVDWVVGAILLFSTQYIMTFIINVNESMITVMADIEANMKDKTRKEFHKEEVEINNDELELDLYQEVRTRAYDAKGVNGISGMLMYMALVAMAYRYTFIYLRRLFTIIILTLMAPGIAFSYAIQKVSTGKSSAFSKWLQEYMVNVLIQTVHALIYVTFISYALMISIDSIPGTIYALVVMHYMPKFDETFRKIFKFNGSGLHDEDLKSTSAKQVMATLKHAGAMVGAASVVGKLPTSKLVTAPLKGALGGAGLLKSAVGTKIADKVIDNLADQEAETMTSTLSNIDEVLALDGAESKEYKSFMEEKGTLPEGEQQQYGLREQDVIAKEIDKRIGSAMKALEKNPEDKEALAKLTQAMKLKEEFDKIGTFGGSKRKAAMFALANSYKQKYHPDKYTKLVVGADGKVKRKWKVNPFAFHYDPAANKLISDGAWAVTRDNNAFYKTLTKNGLPMTLVKNIADPGGLYKEIVDNTNYSPEMKKMLGQQAKVVGDLLRSTKILAAGFGTLVSDPKIGMGLLALGSQPRRDFKGMYGMHDPNRFAPRKDKVAKTYAFNRFSAATESEIGRRALALAEKAQIDYENSNIPGLSKEALKLRVDMAGIVSPNSKYNTSFVTPNLGSISRNKMKYKRLHPMGKALANIATGGMLGYASATVASGGMGRARSHVSTQSILYKVAEQANKELNKQKDAFIEDTLRSEADYYQMLVKEDEQALQQYAQEKLQQLDDDLGYEALKQAATVSVFTEIEKKAEEDDGTKRYTISRDKEKEKETPEEETREEESKKEKDVEEQVETIILTGEINRSAQAIVDKAVAKKVIELASTGTLPKDLNNTDIAGIEHEISLIMEQYGLSKDIGRISDLQQRIKQTSRKMIDDAKAMQEGRELPKDSDHKLEKIIVDMAVRDTVKGKADQMNAENKAEGPIQLPKEGEQPKKRKTLRDFLTSDEFESKVRDSAQETIHKIAFGGSSEEVARRIAAQKDREEAQGRREQSTKAFTESKTADDNGRVIPRSEVRISEDAVQRSVSSMRVVNSKLDIAIRDVGKGGAGQTPNGGKATSGKPTEASTSKTQMDARRKITLEEASMVVADDLLDMVAPPPEEQAKRMAEQRAKADMASVDTVLGALIQNSALRDDPREVELIEARTRRMRSNLMKLQHLNQEAATANIKGKGSNKDYRTASNDADVLQIVLDEIPQDKPQERAEAQRKLEEKKQEVRTNGPLVNLETMLDTTKENARGRYAQQNDGKDPREGLNLRESVTKKRKDLKKALEDEAKKGNN